MSLNVLYIIGVELDTLNILELVFVDNSGKYEWYVYE